VAHAESITERLLANRSGLTKELSRRRGSQLARARHTVDVEAGATGPSTWLWWRNTLISPIASPPSAGITTTSTSTWPRSPGRKNSS